MTKWLYVTLTLLLVLGCTWWTEQKQVPLNENVLRLHVVANSDDPADQALKLAVKDRVVKLMREEFKSASICLSPAVGFAKYRYY
jgi:stage II sporulation protein R